jgi:uncharacterized protein (TIGR02145 family)/uncharacterized repeat protein (TIGR02543 family)
MNNNKNFLRTMGGLTCILIAASMSFLFTCDKVPEHCGNGEPYDPLFQFCSGGKAYSLCSGYSYNPLTQRCVDDVIVIPCDDGSFVKQGTLCRGYAVTVSVVPTEPTPGGYVIFTPDKRSFSAGEEVAVQAIAYGGYKFIGWSGAGEAGNTNPSVILKMDGNKSITAMFQKIGADGADEHVLAVSATPPHGGTVTVFADGAEFTVGSTIHKHGATVNIHAEAETGYTFTGWSGASASTSTPITITMNENQTLVATFTPVKHTLTVNANPDGGGAVYVDNTLSTGSTTYHDYGTAVTVLARPDTGYVFTRWSGASTSTDTLITVIMDNDKTLTANFQPKQTYKLTLFADPSNYGSVYSAKQSGIAEGDTVGISAGENVGYSFQTWKVMSGEAAIASENSMTTIVTLRSDATIAATFVPTPPGTYTLTVTRNPTEGGATDPAASQSNIEAGKPFNISADEKHGYYRFVNWTVTTGEASLYNANDRTTSVTLRSDATIAANFLRVICTLTVNANPASGGNVAPTSRQYIPSYTTVNISADTNNGYKFVNWAVSGTAAIVTPANKATTVTMDSSNATVTANFLAQYEVCFNTNGGTPNTIPCIAPVDNGTALGSLFPNDPSKLGSEFGGWFDTTTGRQYTKDTPIDKNLNNRAILIAAWTTNCYNVSFYDPVGGIPTPPASAICVPHGDSLGSRFPAKPAKAGYRFVGWFDTPAATGGKEYTSSTPITERVSLTARWNRVQYLACFDANGGTPNTIPCITVDSGDTIGPRWPANPTRKGYTFSGWFDTPAATGGTQYTSTTIITRSVSLYARWANIVIYDARDGKTYKTVRIENYTWMAQNLNYTTASNSLCYGNATSNCDMYGRLYEWNTALTACPSGWRLPTRAVWDDLVQAAGGSSVAGQKLKSETGWGTNTGTDVFGFSALPGGSNYGNTFEEGGASGYWWSATEYNSASAYRQGMYRGNNSVSDASKPKSDRKSVRCVQD